MVNNVQLKKASISIDIVRHFATLDETKILYIDRTDIEMATH